MPRVIVTRTKGQSGSLSEKLTALGYEVINVPVIKIISLMADGQLKKAFSRHKYDWIFFTSQNGVNEFCAFLERTGKDIRILGESKICAIGSETAKSLKGIGIKPDYTPSQFVSEAVVGHFKNTKFKGPVSPRALILRSKISRDALPRGLKEAGFAVVETIDLYDTVKPEESALAIKDAFNPEFAIGVRQNVSNSLRILRYARKIVLSVSQWIRLREFCSHALSSQRFRPFSSNPTAKSGFKEKIDFVTFTSSSTVDNFIKLLGRSYRRRLFGVKIVSIGPITSGTLKKFGLKIDAEAKTHTIDGLVTAIKLYPKF